MSFGELLGLMLAVAIGGLLWGNLKAREIANTAIRAACRNEGLQFLDDTVGLKSLRPVRADDGHLRCRRVYGFEFSTDGSDRRRGNVTMIGNEITLVNVGATPTDFRQRLH